MNGMKKTTYLVLVFALFVIEEGICLHAWGGVNEDVEGGEEQVTTPKENYHISTLSRKLLAFPGYNNNTGSDLVPGTDPGFGFGSGSNMGSGSSMGSNTDLVPDANPDPRFNFGSGPNMGSGSSTDLVLDANPISGTGTGSSFTIGPGGPGCSTLDILVDQFASGTLWNGIPTYTVIITNTCFAGSNGTGSCTFSDIHLSCGWFSSYILVNPDVFHRIAYNDCLLKNGGNLNPKEAVSFVYADSFPYPLSVTSATC
ncbi:PREDICTED: putative per-hexamer repeat protein 5 [Ipomoea nil]|uniref:putative per-hexamer repeat protein 5 n=1 Tax=Ipomoea nil TaxID=35883 RepID=UPI0009013F1C|nr:PREDICTED: putative per-hexamer repeat protein 5 [Ipomoea nil]